MEYINKLKNTKVLAVLSVFIVLGVLGGLFLFIRHQATPLEDDSMLSTQNLPSLSPEDIGMVVTVRSDKRALMFKLNKAQDIEHVSYEIDYDKELDGQTIPEGILGEMNIAEDGITKTDYRDFGTCSAGKCKYDKVVSDITIKLVVTKTDGKTYQVTKVVKL
jgi:hypothetical protein